MRSRVELFERIRRDSRLEGMGIRALARKHRVHRRTVRQALASAVPPERKQVERPSPVLDAWKPLIQVWVTTDEALPENLVGAAGGLGGFLPPIVMGLVYQATGDYAIGLMLLSDVALAGLVYTAWRLGVRGGARPRGRPG